MQAYLRFGSFILVISLVLFLIVTPLQATLGDHPDSETPGSREAVIFSPIGKKDVRISVAMDTFTNYVEQHQYQVKRLTDDTEFGLPVKPTDDKPGKATAANFLDLSEKGIVWINTHTVGGNSLLVEAYGTAAARDAALAAYNAKPGKPFVADDLAACGFSDHMANAAFGICITKQGIRNHFKDRESIVHLAACCSNGFKDDFNAREFFSYSGLAGALAVRNDANLLWGRMHGEINNGEKRAARIAYNAGGFTAGFSHEHKGGKLDTVLSPAVKQHVPPKDASFVVPITVPASVTFDTKMDTTVPPNQVLSVRGCDAKIINPQWSGDFTITFGLQLNTTGQATIRVDPKKAHAKGHALKKQFEFQNDLDGNLVPDMKDHIGPNGDPFEWKVFCTAEERTPTPTQTMTPTQTSTPPAPS